MTAYPHPYPCLEADLKKLKENLAVLTEYCHDSEIGVCGVLMGSLCAPEIIRTYAQSDIKSIASPRIDCLERISQFGTNGKPLMLLRIPALSELSSVVEYCDISLQSELTVLRALNDEAKRQGRRHAVLLMIDLGDLREGFWNEEDVLAAAVEVESKLESLHLAGVGVNLGCYGSVVPTVRNMQALVSLAADVEKAIGRKLEYVSGGSSTSLKMVFSGQMPYRINQLRVGEFALLGGFDSFYPPVMHRDVFTLRAEVVECRDKPSFPIGQLGVNTFGEDGKYEERGIRRRAIVAIGRVDYGSASFIKPRVNGIEVLGASSDYTILDVEAVKDSIQVGDILEFDVSYGALLHLTNSQNIFLNCKK